MKTIKNSKELTTLEVGDKVVFGDLEYEVVYSGTFLNDYYLDNLRGVNNVIFEHLNINKRDFIENLGINADCSCDFPETKSLEALTAIVSALFKEYEKQNDPPKTWEEFCERNPIKKRESWIECFDGKILECSKIEGERRDLQMDKNMCTSKQEAEAFLALMQLRQLRKAYVKDWEPDWTNSMVPKYSITCIEGVLSIFNTVTIHRSMSFPNSELANQFLNNFKDLLEIAKPLL